MCSALIEIGKRFPESASMPLAISIEILSAFDLLIFLTKVTIFCENFRLKPTPKMLSTIIEYLFIFKSLKFFIIFKSSLTLSLERGKKTSTL